MRSSSLQLAFRIMVSAAFISGSPAIAGEAAFFKVSAPAGFSELENERQLIVDVFFRGESIGQSVVNISKAGVRFEQPAELIQKLEGLVEDHKLGAWLEDPLPGNFAKACGISPRDDCGFLQPDTVAVIVDEDRFRLDLFVNPSQFSVQPEKVSYLEAPAGDFTLVSRFGGAISGGASSEVVYHLQNRTVLAVRDVRVRSDTAYVSGEGIAFDSLAAERDRNDWRQIAGLFWAPGGDFTGRRKLVGAAIVSQLDTRIDRRALTGTPISIVLQAPAKVDLLTEGRLLFSRIYSPGDVTIDTSSLPDGSYDLELRIQESGRSPRVERRFFTKGTDIAPVGRPLYSAMAGFLADDRGRPQWSWPYYQFSAAVRVAPTVGLDSRIFGTESKAIGEAGAIWLTSFAKVRAAALISTAGDIGGAIRASTASNGPISASFDLRKVKSAGDKPILPVSGSLGSFSEELANQLGDSGSYTQGSLYIAARIRAVLLRLSGFYRKSGDFDASYNVGASLEVPVKRGNGWNLVFQADVRKSDRDVAGFFGLRASLNSPSVSASALAGLQYWKNEGTKPTGEVQVSSSREIGANTALSGNAGVATDNSGTSGRLGLYLSSPKVGLRGDLLHDFSGSGRTEYVGSFDTAMVFGASQVWMGAKNVTDGVLVVSPKGAAAEQKFEVLVDDGVRGVATKAEPLLLFLQPYEKYRVRVRPVGQAMADYDSSEKLVTLHPGKVVNLEWTAQPTVIVFGRALDEQGKPIVNARIDGKHGIAQTDSSGYFQLEAESGEALKVARVSTDGCVLAAQIRMSAEQYFDAGDMVCR